MSARMTQQELESYLWGAAVILRGLVDAGDYKQFVSRSRSSSGCPMCGMKTTPPRSRTRMATPLTLKLPRMTAS